MALANINGFYVGYFTAAGGNGVVIFIIRDGSIAGADLNTHFDGSYLWDEDRRTFIGDMNVRMKPGSTSIQGVLSGPKGIEYKIALELPRNFTDLPFITLSTPFGPVNARFEKIREL